MEKNIVVIICAKGNKNIRAISNFVTSETSLNTVLKNALQKLIIREKKILKECEIKQGREVKYDSQDCVK